MARPTQYFAPNTGQRTTNFLDIINGINDQINGINDAQQSAADSGVVINVFADASLDTLRVPDSVVVTTTTSSLITWDSGYRFYQGAWQ